MQVFGSKSALIGRLSLSYRSISRSALDLLTRYDWPGNVRELRNTVEGMVLAARRGPLLGAMDVPATLKRRAAAGASEIRIPAGATMDEIERIVIEETLEASGYDKKACARTLGIGLRTLYRKLKAYEPL